MATTKVDGRKPGIVIRSRSPVPDLTGPTPDTEWLVEGLHGIAEQKAIGFALVPDNFNEHTKFAEEIDIAQDPLLTVCMSKEI